MTKARERLDRDLLHTQGTVNCALAVAELAIDHAIVAYRLQEVRWPGLQQRVSRLRTAGHSASPDTITTPDGMTQRIDVPAEIRTYLDDALKGTSDR
jgi:hypothetical protein